MGKRPLGRSRHRWMDNIKMDLLEIGVSVVDWIGLAQDRYRWRALVNSVMNFRVPQYAGNYRVAAQLVASQVVFNSTELVSQSSWSPAALTNDMWPSRHCFGHLHTCTLAHLHFLHTHLIICVFKPS
jgi:hypothetical protein